MGIDCCSPELGEVAVVLAGYFFVPPDDLVVSEELGEDCEIVAVAAAGGVFVAMRCYDCFVGELQGVLGYSAEL